jgi:hypothetical protein
MPRQTRETLLRSPNRQWVVQSLLGPSHQPEERPGITPASDLYRTARMKLPLSGCRTRSPATVSSDAEFGFQVVARRLARGEELGPGP